MDKLNTNVNKTVKIKTCIYRIIKNITKKFINVYKIKVKI